MRKCERYQIKRKSKNKLLRVKDLEHWRALKDQIKHKVEKTPLLSLRQLSFLPKIYIGYSERLII